MDLALNNLQRLICHKTQQTKPNQTISFFLLKRKQWNISATVNPFFPVQ